MWWRTRTTDAPIERIQPAYPASPFADDPLPSFGKRRREANSDAADRQQRQPKPEPTQDSAPRPTGAARSPAPASLARQSAAQKSEFVPLASYELEPTPEIGHAILEGNALKKYSTYTPLGLKANPQLQRGSQVDEKV